MPPAPRPATRATINAIFRDLPAGSAGFDDAFEYLTVSKDEDVVRSCAFIGWTPVPAVGPAARSNEVTAPRDIITAAVCSAARLATTVAARNAWRAADVLTGRLRTSTLNRLAAAMKSLGAFTATFQDQELHRRAMVELLLKQPNLSALEVDDQDLERPTAFDTPGRAPPAPGAGPRRRNARQPPAPPPAQAVAAGLPGPAELKWLTLTRVADLVDDTSPLPLERLLRLWVLLPGRCQDAERRDARSFVVGNAEVLKSGVARCTPVESPTDALLGRSMRAFVAVALLFPLSDFRPGQLSLDEAIAELTDAMSYAQGAASDAARAVARRLMLSKRAYGDLCSLIGDLDNAEERVLQLERLSTLACPGRHAQALHLRLSDLDLFAAERSPLLTAARNAGKSGVELFDLLVADAAATGIDPVTSSAGVTGGEPSDGGTRRFSARALNLALQGDDMFVQTAEKIDAQNTGTAAGRLKVLELATGSGCVIFQQVLDRSEGLRQRSEALGALHTSMAEATVYFGQRQAADDKGVVDPLAKSWEMHPSQIKLLCAGKISEMAHVNPPYGVIELLNLTASEPYEPVPDGQLYITESVLEALGPFLHKALVAWLGAGVAVSTTGYTFKTLCDAQRDYVKWIHQQGDQVQQELLPHADQIFRSALQKVDQELRMVLDSTEPHKAAFGHVLCFGGAYDQAIEAKKDGLKPLITIHRALPGLMPTSAPRSLPGVRLASQAPKRGRDGEGDVDEPPAKKPSKKSKAPKGPPEAPKPGSKKGLARWLDDDTLRFGADTFKVSEYAKELDLTPEQTAELCWPVLCSHQSIEWALAFCPCSEQDDHKGTTAKAHRRPKGFDLDRFLKDFGTKGAPPSKGKGKGKK